MTRRRRKNNPSGGGGGGHEAAGVMRWLLTYADIITLLLGVFIILASISQIMEEKQKELAEAFQQMFAMSIFDRSARPTPISTEESGQTGVLGAGSSFSPVRLKARFTSAFRQEIKKEKVQVQQVRGNIVVRFKDMVFFDVGSAQLRPESIDVLRRLAGILESIDNEVIIEGHTDATPINTSQFRSNWELSTQRATAVIHFLCEHAKASGFDEKKLQDYCRRLSAKGEGEFHPIIQDNLYDPRNRRIDVIILSPPNKEKEILF